MYTKATSKITKQRIVTNTSTYIYVERERQRDLINPKEKGKRGQDKKKQKAR